jgi:hypothetical protein
MPAQHTQRCRRPSARPAPTSRLAPRTASEVQTVASTDPVHQPVVVNLQGHSGIASVGLSVKSATVAFLSARSATPIVVLGRPQGEAALGSRRRCESGMLKGFASSLALASTLAVTALSPAAAYHHRPHFVFARLGAGVCDGLVCSGAFFATPSEACGLAFFVPSTTRFVRPVRQAVCPSGLGVTMYQMVR